MLTSRVRATLLLVALVLVIVAVMLRWRRDVRTAPRAVEVSVTVARADGGPAYAPPSLPPSTNPGTATDAGALHRFASATWGSGPDQLGRMHPQEGNPEAPMSLTVARDGTVTVLDQVNHRLVRYGRDGHPLGTTNAVLTAPQDVAVARNGTVAVLDRLADRTVALLGPDGQVRGRLPLEGTGIPEGGGVSAMLIDGDSVYVEREHGDLVRIGDVYGTVDPDRPSIPGRPTRDGLSYLTAGLIDAPAGRFYVNSIARDTGQHRFTRDLQVELGLTGILLLDTDLAGVIYVAVGGAPAGGGTQLVALLCLDPTDGHALGQTLLPANTSPDETFREMTVLDEGGVLYAVRTEAGVELQRYDCRPQQ